MTFSTIFKNTITYRNTLLTVPPLTLKTAVTAVLAAILSGCSGLEATPLPTADSDPAKQVDAFTGKPRLLVLTDIGNEPDDQMSLVRLLLYSNEIEIAGLVATTSTWQQDTVNPHTIHKVLDAYAKVETNLKRHDISFMSAATLKQRVRAGLATYGMTTVATETLTPGASLLIEATDADDTRPLWIAVWGGANTLAQALQEVRETRSESELKQFIAKLRVYSISDQDDAGPWIRRNFPSLYYIGYPSNPSAETYSRATWTGIAGDRMYKNSAGADFTKVSNPWLDEHIRSQGPLGKAYPHYHFIMEGDSPSFMNLVGNGLAAYQNPTWGGWGGRYIYRTPYGETDPMWTQGNLSFSPTGSSADAVEGSDGITYTSDQATIWRWREAFQNDFAARMDWTIQPPRQANHPPRVMVNQQPGRLPIEITARVGDTFTLDARGSMDPDGDQITYSWFYYREAGFGGPSQFDPEAWKTAVTTDEPWQTMVARARVHLETTTANQSEVRALSPGQAHIILAVKDQGEPALTSYRRVIVTIVGE